MRIYQAGPLFSEAEREWHKALKARLLTAGHEVIWPGDLITQEEIDRKVKGIIETVGLEEHVYKVKKMNIIMFVYIRKMRIMIIMKKI